MKTIGTGLAAILVCPLCGCATIGIPATSDYDTRAVLAIPSRFLSDSASMIGWSYSNMRPARRIKIILSGVTVYDNVIGSTPWNPRYFEKTALKPGTYTLTVLDRDYAESATITFESAKTRHIIIGLGPLQVYALDCEPHSI